MSTLTLYHVTPLWRCASIDRVGLDPSRSRGKLPCVWLCTRGRLGWALAHLADKKDLRPSCFVAYVVRVTPRRLVRRRRGIYTCDTVLRPARRLLWRELCARAGWEG